MEGLDDIGLTLRHEADISAFEAARPSYLPTSAVRGVSEGLEAELAVRLRDAHRRVATPRRAGRPEGPRGKASHRADRRVEARPRPRVGPARPLLADLDAGRLPVAGEDDEQLGG